MIKGILREGSAPTMIRLTKQKKMNRLASKEAINYAKERNDPTYQKYKKVRNKFLKLKNKLITKYKTKGKKRAKDIIYGTSESSGESKKKK